MNVLIVDDDESIRVFMGQLMELEGHKAFFAGDGEDAYAVLKENEIDFVFLDLLMPKVSGVTMLTTPTLINGKMFPADYRLAIMSGTPQYAPKGFKLLNKPFDFEDALRCLDV